MSTYPDFKNPQEFIDYYAEQYKNHLKQYDIKINKSGFIGFMLNILAWTNFDVKQYYDYLFKEAFVGTATSDENLYLHSSIYGYIPGFAKAAKADGYFTLDLSTFPTIRSGVVKREIYFASDIPLSFIIDDKTFTTQSKYRFIQQNGGYYSSIIDSAGKTHQIVSPSNILNAQFYDVYQYEIDEYELNIPNYSYGTYYSYTFDIQDEYIYDILVYIKIQDAEFEEEYKVSPTKFQYDGSSKVVFVKNLSSSKVYIEFGSGLKGNWVPGSVARIKILKSKGVFGNFESDNLITSLKTPSNIICVDTYTDGTISTPAYYDAKSYLNVRFNYSEDGENPLSGDGLRTEITNFIQSRDTLINEDDFNNKYPKDFKFLFKKISVFDNVFYACTALRDRYHNIVKTTNYTFELDSSDFDVADGIYVVHPEFTINTDTFISPFVYKYSATMDWYQGYLVFDTLTTSFVDIQYDDVVYTYDSPPLFLYIVYDAANSKTRISVKSYQDLSAYTIMMSCDDFGLVPTYMTINPLDSTEFYYDYDSGDIGLIWENNFIINITCYINGNLKFRASSSEITQVYDTSDQLVVSKYTDPSDDIVYVTNVPVILKSEYDLDKIFYLNKLQTFIDFKDKRMESDTVYYRNLNTYYVDQTTLNAVSPHEYAFDLTLPLKLIVSLTIDIDYVRTNSVNLSSEKDKIQLQLATILQNEYTGTNFSFYKSKLTKFLMEYPYIQSTTLTVKDSTASPNFITILDINKDLDIFQNLNTNKLNAIKYMPVFFWWDIDNITVNFIK